MSSGELNQKLLGGLATSGEQDKKEDNEIMKGLKDKFSNAGTKMQKVNKKDSNFVAGISNFTKKVGGKCCTFTQNKEKLNKRLFYGYGIMDFVIIAWLIYFAISHHRGYIFMVLILIYLPNNILLLLVLIMDNKVARNLYQSWLRFKLVVQGFMLPLIIMMYDEHGIEANVCSRYLESYNITMSESELQTIINRENFTLLFDANADHLNQLQLQQMYQEEEKSFIAATRRKLDIAYAAMKHRLAPSQVQHIMDLAEEGGHDPTHGKIQKGEGAPQLPLTSEQKEMRYIQFCATSVVLSTFGIIVFYQIMTGHQYFVARERLIMKEKDDDFSANLNAKIKEGDPEVLLKELEKAYSALDKEIKRRGSQTQQQYWETSKVSEVSDKVDSGPVSYSIN